jgi:hypothetical protein
MGGLIHDKETESPVVDVYKKPSTRWFWIIVWAMYDQRVSTTRTSEYLYLYTLSRELLGPRSSCLVVDIVSEPRIWSRSTNAVSLKTQLQMTESERTTTPPRTSVTSTLGRSVSLVCAMRGFSDIEG